MLIGAATVDLGDSVANSLAAIAVVISVIALFTADSRAKDANKIALDANETSREARDIAREANKISQRAVGISERTDLREMMLALRGPLNEVLGKLLKLSGPESYLDFQESIDCLSEIETALGLMYGIVWRDTPLSEYINKCREVAWNLRSSNHVIQDLNSKILASDDPRVLSEMNRASRSLDTCANFMRHHLSLATTNVPDDLEWTARLNSLVKFRGRMRTSLVKLYEMVEGVSTKEAEEYIFF